ncbi:MAG: hypothetical protein D8H96_12990 [Lautropia sp.]|nr:MAG: hypothetical protein D8H96_12990 [Lautropia sp.]
MIRKSDPARRSAATSIRQAAALALLTSLAACGGGNDTPQTIDASGGEISAKATTGQAARHAGNGTPNAGSAARNSGATTKDTGTDGTAQAATGDAAAAQNASGATPAREPATVSASGVRGDVLATALRGSYSDVTAGGDPWPVPLLNATGQPPEGKITDDTMVAGIDQMTYDKAGTNGIGPYAWKAHSFPWTNNGAAPANPIAKDTIEFGLSAHGPLPASTVNDAADADVLQIGPLASLQTELPSTDNAGAARAAMLGTSSTTIIRRLTVYKLDPNQYLHTWRFGSEGPDNSTPELGLFLKKGYADNQFQLCWRVEDNRTDMHRTGCSIWEVAADWKPGKSLKAVGYYLMDSIRNPGIAGQWINRHYHTKLSAQ